MARTTTATKRPDLNINYTAYPAARDFHASPAFMRVLLGPVGCYSGDTEYLSPSGWQRIDTYTGGLVAQYQDGVCQMVEPEAYINLPCESMWRFHNSHTLDMMLSGEHRMLLYDGSGRLVVKQADAVAVKPSRHTVPTNFKLSGSGVDMSDAALRVMVMVHADGHFPQKAVGNYCVVEFHKPRKAGACVELLEAAGISFDDRSYYREDKAVWVYRFVFQAPAHTKCWDGYWGVTQAQAEVILDEFWRWDGLFTTDEYRYYTTVKGDADFMQFLAHACGRRASVSSPDYAHRTDRDTTNYKPGYVVHLTAPGSRKSKVTLRGDNTTIERVPSPDGRKYCFTVPSGFLVMRRNGCVFVSGNSGKSSATWLELFRRACEEHPDDTGTRSSHHLCVRDTYAMLKATTIKDFQSWFGRIGEVVYDSPIRGKVSIPLPDGTTLDWNLSFMSLDGGDKSLDALRGMQITGAYVNEGHSVSRDVYDVITTRVGRYRPSGRDPKWKGIIADSNFGHQGCYLHSLYVNPPPTVEFFEQPPAAFWNPATNKWVLNPHCDNIQNLPGGLDYYQKMLTMDTGYIKQFLANQWAVKTSGKQIYPEYSPQAHLVRGTIQHDPRLPLIIGMDFGLHVAATFNQLSPMGKLMTFRELWDDDTDLESFLDRQLVPTLRSHYPGVKAIVSGDPAGMGRSALDKRTAFAVLKSRGLMAFPAVTNDPVKRWGSVRYFLTRNGGYGVHHSCKRLVEGFEGGYGYRKKGPDEYADEAEKNVYSHVADAQGYACLYARFGAKQHTDPMRHLAEMRKAEQAKANGRLQTGANREFFWA